MTRLDRILAHSLININTVYMKNDKVLFGVLKLLHETHTYKKIKIIICMFVLMNINMSFCYTETIMSDNEKLPLFSNGILTSPISQ